MIPTATADKILAAKKCGDLFSKADKATVVLEYRKLAKEFHPDVCPLPNAEDVFKHLSKLYEEALDLLAQGQWEISNVVSIRDNCGKTYQGRYLKTFQFELGVAYVADLSVTYILDKQNKRFFDNAINQIGALKYANPNMEEEFSRYLPKIKHQFETRDGQYCLILDKTPDVFLLSDILAYYKNSIPDRHAAWIISRLCNLCCYFDYLVFAPHLTSSKTGSYNPKKILLENDLQNEDIEFCYVTRSYFTRHGFGPFPTECDKKELFGMDVEEKYNHENEFQGKFRFGYFDTSRFSCAFHADLAYMLDSFPNSDGVIAMTHLDKTDDMIFASDGKIPARNLEHLKYVSYGETRDCVKIK